MRNKILLFLVLLCINLEVIDCYYTNGCFEKHILLLIKKEILLKYDKLVPSMYKTIGISNEDSIKNISENKRYIYNLKRLLLHEFCHYCGYLNNKNDIYLNIDGLINIKNEKNSGALKINENICKINKIEKIFIKLFGPIGESFIYGKNLLSDYRVEKDINEAANFFYYFYFDLEINKEDLLLSDIIEKVYLFFEKNICEIESIIEKELINFKPNNVFKDIQFKENDQQDFFKEFNLICKVNLDKLEHFKIQLKNMIEEINNNINSGKYNK